MLIPEGFAQVNYEWGGIGLPSFGETTIGVDLDGFTDDPDDAAQAMSVAMSGNVMAHMTSNITLLNTHVKYGPNLTGAEGNYPTSIIGTLGEATTTPNVAYLIKKNTAAGGRMNRGRFYLPGVAEASVDQAGVVADVRRTGLNEKLALYKAAVEASGLSLVLLHSPTSPVLTPTAITSLTCDARAATQRRRMRR